MLDHTVREFRRKAQGLNLARDRNQKAWIATHARPAPFPFRGTWLRNGQAAIRLGPQLLNFREHSGEQGFESFAPSRLLGIGNEVRTIGDRQDVGYRDLPGSYCGSCFDQQLFGQAQP